MSDYTIEHTREIGDTAETTRVEGLGYSEMSELVQVLIFDEDCTCGPRDACDTCGGKPDLGDIENNDAFRGARR